MSSDSSEQKKGSEAVRRRILNEPHWVGNKLGYDRLQPVHSRLIKLIWYSALDRALQAYRGSYKTTSVVIVGLIVHLMFEPDDTCLLTRKTHTKACKIIEEIGAHYERSPLKTLYREAFGVDLGKLPVNRKDRIVLPTKTRKTAMGNIDAMGIDTSQTGDHYDILINDDIVTIEDKTSKAERKKTITRLGEQHNVRNPGGRIFNIGTPWHKDDAWTKITPPYKFPLGCGELKLPTFTKQHVEGLQDKLTAQEFASNYLLNHISDAGGTFGDPVYAGGENPEWPEALDMIAQCDAGYKGECTTALTMLGKRKGQLFGIGWVWDEPLPELYAKIALKMKKWRGGTLWMEDNADKGLGAIGLREHWAIVEEYHEPVNKHVKIVTFAKAMFQKILWHRDTSPMYMAQIQDYTEGQEPIDAPDSLASLLRQMKEAKATTEQHAGGAPKGDAKVAEYTEPPSSRRITRRKAGR